MKNKLIVDIVQISFITAVYVVLTIALGSISYSNIQIRVSELLLVLVLFNKKYSISLILGCLIANFLSPYFLWDVLFGTLGTVLSVAGLILIKKWFSLLIFPPIFNGIFVGIEIYMIDGINFFLTFGYVLAGELIVMFAATGLYLLLRNNKVVVEYLKDK